jgi:uncharacterized protein (DUF2236 family)
LDFAGPLGDPGCFGPGSAVCHVHSHLPALVFGLRCAAYLERFDPSIFWMGVDQLPGSDPARSRAKAEEMA